MRPGGGDQIRHRPKRRPKTFDWITTWGEWYGVYELSDDKLTIYISRKTQIRAAILIPKAGPRHRSLQLQETAQVIGGPRMRFSLALLILSAFPLSAAPVPKELRTPAIVGTWEITESNVWGERSPQYNGQRWYFGADGTFTISERQPAAAYAPPDCRGSYVLGERGSTSYSANRACRRSRASNATGGS